MPLIKSISGIRGTIGNRVGEDLTNDDVILFTISYIKWLKSVYFSSNHSVVVGRDARTSGPMIESLVIQTLTSMGVNVISLGLSTTPTVEIAVTEENADGGIIITASHNPKNWNALKLLNHKGEFISQSDGNNILAIAETKPTIEKNIQKGNVKKVDNYISKHIDLILNLNSVNVQSIKKKQLKIVVDAVNSTGGIAIPELLKKMGVEVVELYCTPNGEFPHDPEPLKDNLKELSELVVKTKADLGIVVDPDVDRLAFVCENGDVFGEEYTLVACADYYLQQNPGNTVSNLSSSRAMKDLSNSKNCNHYFSKVGEVNVVELMKDKNAVIGGEGNGGIILPEFHYGRDALVGIALFLTHFSNLNMKMTELKNSLPVYYMSKSKVKLGVGVKLEEILKSMRDKYSEEEINTLDGLKIDFKDSWVHLRKSNTEPIIRIYTEAKSQNEANLLAEKFVSEISKY